MNINTAFPSKYLKAADLGTSRVVVTISHLKMEDIVGDGDHKAVLYFTGKEKGLVLNKTNANSIVEICGSDETDAWRGYRIVLFPTKTEFQGKRVACIRVDPAPNGQVAAPVAERLPPPAPTAAEVFDDSDIPF